IRDDLVTGVQTCALPISPLTFTAFAVPGAVNASQTSVVASPAALTASNGTSASTVTVTARDQYGNPVRGRTVTLAATGTANAIRSEERRVGKEESQGEGA